MSLAYGIIALISLCMVGVCVVLDKKRDVWLLLVFVSVSICNLGYFMLSVSQSLGSALNSNRLSYLGSVFLPFFLLMMVLRLCGMKRPKPLMIILVTIGILMLGITTSPGILPIYYSTVDIEIVDGATKLVREYGPLHVLYYVYLIGYMLSMVGVAVYAIAKRKIKSHLHTILLLCIVFCNILIWLVEQFLPRGFEWLSVSYIMTECLILAVYRSMQKQGLMSKEGRMPSYTINVLLTIFLLLFANFVRVITMDTSQVMYVISHIVVLMIYLGILVSWGISVYDRIVNKTIRRHLINILDKAWVMYNVTELTSLSCQDNLLTCLDLSKNTKLSTVSTGTQYCTVESVTDDILDLNVFSNFDISKVQKKSDGSGGTYQFNVKSSNSFSATNNYKNVGEDLLLNVDGKNCYVYYSYLVGTKSNGTEIYMSVELEIDNKYYTVKCETLGVALKAFGYSTGVGADITTAKRGNSIQFVIEVDAGSSLYGKKLAVFSRAVGGDKVAVSEYTYNGTVYYSVSSINAPTSIIVEEGHECILTDWAPVGNNTSEHERHCTVTGCTESETEYCSNYYGLEYHADHDTMQKDCTRCGRQYTWEIDASASVHVPAADAKCNAPGNTEFWICGHCNKYFLDENCQHEVTPSQVYINPLEHNYVNNVCSECGHKIRSARFEESLR